MRIKTITVALLLGMFFAAHGAESKEQREPRDTPLGGWQRIVIRYEGTDRPDGTGIYAYDEDRRGVYFQCSAQQISVSFLVEPGDIRELFRQRTSRRRVRDLTVTFSDGSALTTQTLYMPRFKIAVTAARDFVARVFKSALNAEAITVELKRHDPFTIQFPARDSNFNAFIEACPLIK